MSIIKVIIIKGMNTVHHGLVVERPPGDRKVGGSIPGWAIPKTFKMVVITSLLGAQALRVNITTGSSMSV